MFTITIVPKKEVKNMSEINNSNENTFNAEYTEKPAGQERKGKDRKPSRILPIVISAALIGGMTGFGGGMIAYKLIGGETPTVIYKAAETADSTHSTSNVSSTSDLSTTDIAAKAAPSVVEINIKGVATTYGLFGGTYETEAAGSGVILSQDGYIITNNHVVEDGTEYKVITYDGTEYSAELVGTDEKSDIAVLKIDADNLTPATIGNSDNVQVGDKAVVIGNPLGTLGGTVTDGIISAVNREITINNESMSLLQTNATINSGNSGGGMFDGQGNLIGIVNAKESGTTSSGTTIEGLGFAIPVNEAMDVAQQLMTYGTVTNRATLGVHVAEVAEGTRGYTPGLYITDVVSGGAADQAGLKAYDRIVSADGKDITDYADLSSVLNDKKVGDTIKLTIERDGSQSEVTVTLQASSSSSN